MSALNTVYIIYNPKSTGPAKVHAEEMQQTLHEKTTIRCELLKTEYATHAIELAKSHAGQGVMIISSSGDGGFHEIINGALQSNASDQTTVGLLPSGNANDHYTARHIDDTLTRIAKHDTSTMDVLKVTWDKTTVYAHSYTGLGITAEIGEELTRKRPNILMEIWLVLTGLIKRHPVRIIIAGKKRYYDSIICNLIGHMSKYLTTSEKHRPKDGTFDLVIKRHSSLGALFRHLLKHAANDEIHDAASLRALEFTTTHNTPIQLDGEVYHIPAHTTVHVECVPNALTSII